MTTEFKWPARGTVTPAAWTPASEAGIKFWFRADTLAETAGVVTSWTDKSGNGFDAIPSGSPTVVPNVVAGKPVVRLVSASSQYFTFGAGFAFAKVNSPYTMMAVMKYSDALGSGLFAALISLTSDAGATVFSSYFAANSAGYSPFSVGGGTAASDTNTGSNIDYYSNFWALTSIYNGAGSLSTGANYEWFKDSVSVGALTDGAGSVNTGSAGSAIGFYPGGGLFPDMDIAEIAFWSKAFDSDAQTNLNDYLLNRYSL